MPVTFLLPSGPKNLESLFPGVDFTQVDEYYLQIKDQDSLEVLATTNHFNRSCCCNDDTIRLFFVNYLGGIDAINLRQPTEETEVVSTTWKKPLQYPLAKWDGGTQRFNVTSNETWTAINTCFTETDQEWLKELMATPNAWIQWIGTQGQDDDYIPVVISNGKFLTKKNNERYEYVLQIEFVMANENIILRN
jgi:hypothetical protein